MATCFAPRSSKTTLYRDSHARRPKQALVGRFSNSQAQFDRIRVSTLSTFILCTPACGIIMFNMFNAITCSRSRITSFVGSSCRFPRPLSSPSRITSTESARTLNWTSDSDFGILIGTSTAPVPLSIHIGNFDHAQLFRADTVIVLCVCLVFVACRKDRPCCRNGDLMGIPYNIPTVS
jgi:hypothetical protein